MNILFLYGSAINPERGGVQRVTAVLADEFARRGNGVFYLSLPKNRAETADATRQFFLPNDDYTSAENRAFLKDFLARERIDVLVNQGGTGRDCSFLAETARSAGVALISVVHNGLLDVARNYRASHEHSWEKHGFGFLCAIADFAPVRALLIAAYLRKYRAHFRRLCKNSDVVLLLSDGYKRDLAKYMPNGRCPGNVRAIPNPCSFPMDKSEKDFPEKHSRKELLYVGRVDFSQKRVDLLFSVWRRLEKDFPGWELTIVGGGSNLPEAKRIAKRAGLSRVNFEGFRDSKEYFRRAPIACMTSSFEGFPMALGEAISCGCVPVAFDSYAAARDIIDDGKSGVLVPPMDCEKYAAALAALMRDPALRERFSRAAFEKSKQFSVEFIGDKWLALFEELCSRRDKSSSAGTPLCTSATSAAKENGSQNF